MNSHTNIQNFAANQGLKMNEQQMSRTFCVAMLWFSCLSSPVLS